MQAPNVGYTSAFILQALADNDAEMAAVAAAGGGRDGAGKGGQPTIPGMAPGVEWYVGEEVRRLAGRGAGTLHCIDDMSHAYSTAPGVRKAARQGVTEQAIDRR